MASSNSSVTARSVNNSALTAAIAMAETAADVGALYGYDSEVYATADANARDAMMLANKLVAIALAGTRTSKPKPKPTRKPCRYGDACRYAAAGTCRFVHAPPPLTAEELFRQFVGEHFRHFF